jgi:hypothetical protein
MINYTKKQYRKTVKKKYGYKELEKKLDKIFSEYIRLKESDEDGICRCVTCGNYHHYKDIHCGHFIGRSVKATRFNEKNCHPQCVKCNSYRSGEHHIYRKYLVYKYGNEEVEKLENSAIMGGSLSAYQLEEKIIEYREKVKELLKEKGL